MDISQEQLTAAMREAMKGVLVQGFPAIQTQTTTFKEYGDEFMENKSRTVAKTTQSKNGFLYRKHILPAFGEQTLATITRSQVQTFINRMADQSYSMETIKATKCLLSTIMELAASDRLIPANPCKAVKLPKVEKKKKRAPTVEEFKRLLRVSAGHRLWITVPLLFLAGLRIGEMLALTWDDIDMENRLIHVAKTLSTENGSNRAKTDTLSYPNMMRMPIHIHRYLGVRYSNTGAMRLIYRKTSHRTQADITLPIASMRLVSIPKPLGISQDTAIYLPFWMCIATLINFRMKP